MNKKFIYVTFSLLVYSIVLQSQIQKKATNMKFTGIQKTFNYTQINIGSQEEIFPLLCPVREAEWIDGWEYEMIYSKSGLAELNCVFATPHKGDLKTIWQITEYDFNNYKIEFVRVTPKENIVKINIELEYVDNNKTKSHITYQYTGLNKKYNDFIENDLESSFKNSMLYWEKAINHYLKTGDKLLK